MKKQLLVVLALFLNIALFAQKNEIKALEKAIDKKDFGTAMTALKTAEGLIANADDKSKAKFYFLKGKALFGKGMFSEAGIAIKELLDFEKKIGKSKYTNSAGEMLNQLIQKAATSGNKKYAAKDYKGAAKDFYQVYSLSPLDTAFIENAGKAAYFGNDNEQSIKYFQELYDMNYTGISKVYTGIDKEGKEVVLGSEENMRTQKKLGLVKNVKATTSKSKRGEIAKMLAMNYMEVKDNDNALKYIQTARKFSPDNYELLIDEANIYYRKGEKEMFKKRLEEATKLNPNDASLHYNIGVMNMEIGDNDAAIKSFNKAIGVDQNYFNAYVNIGALMLEKNHPLVEKMNNDNTSNAEYDRLKKEQEANYKEALPIYEKAYAIKSDDINVVRVLMGIYSNLDMEEKRVELKTVYDSLK